MDSHERCSRRGFSECMPLAGKMWPSYWYAPSDWGVNSINVNVLSVTCLVFRTGIVVLNFIIILQCVKAEVVFVYLCLILKGIQTSHLNISKPEDGCCMLLCSLCKTTGTGQAPFSECGLICDFELYSSLSWGPILRTSMPMDTRYMYCDWNFRVLHNIWVIFICYDSGHCSRIVSQPSNCALLCRCFVFSLPVIILLTIWSCVYKLKSFWI